MIHGNGALASVFAEADYPHAVDAAARQLAQPGGYPVLRCIYFAHQPPRRASGYPTGRGAVGACLRYPVAALASIAWRSERW